MANRQLYTMKFRSSRLKKYNYNITIDYNKALENGEIIALSDNQLLRTIRKVVVDKAKDKEEIKERILDRDLLEEFHKSITKIRRKNIGNEEESSKSKEKVGILKDKIINMCFVPEYITIVIEHDAHYKHLFHNGLIINGTKFFRLSTSAGQGRVSTVSFCSGEVLESVNELLDNGRDKNKKFSPSKFNAYKGAYGSATKVVTAPRFCVVPDYFSELTFKVNWVTETEGANDDLIETREITREYNRFDGQGLISPEMAMQWSKDLNLDYIPSQFCIRQSYVKGMLNVFPFHEFCELKNNKNYTVKTLYKDKKGNDIEVDLKDIDVIITEGQFKLWDSFSDLDTYKKNCEKNELFWGVSLYTDKKLKDVLKMNYQFLQVLDIKQKDIPELCSEFVEWIKGVNTEDIWQTLLFLMGTKTSRESIERYMKDDSNYWIKSLIINHDLIHDRYIQQKIYNLINKQIKNGCIGSIILEGNNQTLVSDPYAMMEFVCGHKEVKGLLEKDKFYSHYWNEKGVREVVGMRPPLTYRAEATKLTFDSTENQKYWYRYSYGGIIVNVHGNETDCWAGSDWDYDFLSTTSNKVVLRSRFENEMTVVYEAPKPNKIVFTDEDLFNADNFTFGSIIGSITNKSTSAYSLLPYLEEHYGKDSREYKTTLDRIKMCTKLQSAQIDKAKIGKEVKGIPEIWVNKKHIENLKCDEKEKQFLSSIMLDRHPYFFRHLYGMTDKKYKRHMEEYNLSCLHKFGIEIKELTNKQDKTEEEKKYLKYFYDFMPIIDSDSVMNNICKHIESVDFNIRNKIRTDKKDVSYILMRNESIKDETTYEKVHKRYLEFKKEIRNLKSIQANTYKYKYNQKLWRELDFIYEKFKEDMDNICVNIYELVDYLINIFYVEHRSDNKDLLWNTYGNIIISNIIDKNKKPILFPMPSDEKFNKGNKENFVRYLNRDYKLEVVEIDAIQI